ncbi:MAG: TRAP transporter large permease subunit [Candidatus Marinimicrobia bacterium]|nr:TRAP transporter large permease subunit [Candidatus Neomarinimicrobiota bacterium]MCF7827955.1 TRAP transporter large permease subunit [Candidatus Neomarinimicrobiota bacterium]MCF7879290.1 TRAP transporter large permease subunit [Candidatus Neomarinimicrobiota bacterium]
MLGLKTPTSVSSVLEAVESWFTYLILLALMLLPLGEIITRNFLGSSMPGAVLVVQHLTLWIGVVGAALAARYDRLLSFTLGIQFLQGDSKLSHTANFIACTVGSAVSLGLAKASFDLVKSEFEFPTYIMGGVPTWAAELVMPLGFLLIAIRLFMHGTETITERLAGLSVIVGLSMIGIFSSLAGSGIVWVGFVVLFLAIIAGTPVFIALGGAALLLFWHNQVPIASIPSEMYRIVTSPILPTIPLFTLAGYFLSEGGASKRLVRVFRTWFGWMPGGEAIATILVCAFFTAFTGGSGVTILAFGGLLMPLLLRAGYKEEFSLGLVTASGSLGLLFPPSLPIILYAVIAHVPVPNLFLGGIIPGLLLLGLLALWGFRHGAATKSVTRTPFGWQDALDSLWKAKWEVAIPFIILIGIFGGYASLVETAAIAAAYTLAIEVFVYRDLGLGKDFREVLKECAILVGGVLIILGVAMGFTSYLIDAQIPMKTLAWVQAHIESKYVFLLLLNIFLILTGAIMEIFSALVVVVPLITPLGAAFGIDPVHLGIIFLANLELGFLTPPIGMNLFLSSYRFDKPLTEVYLSTVVPLIILLLGVMAITYIPWLTEFLPNLISF